MIEQAADLCERVDCAFVVANDASVMGSDETRALLVEQDAVVEDCPVVSGSKAAVADTIADRLAAFFTGNQGESLAL